MPGKVRIERRSIPFVLKTDFEPGLLTGAQPESGGLDLLMIEPHAKPAHRFGKRDLRRFR